MKEAKEESGLNDIKILNRDIFDIDIHMVPERKGEHSHYHYDVRFLFQADPSSDLIVNRESNALQWFNIGEVSLITIYKSILLFLYFVSYWII